MTAYSVDSSRGQSKLVGKGLCLITERKSMARASVSRSRDVGCTDSHDEQAQVSIVVEMSKA